MLWFYLTPVVYTIDLIPAKFLKFFYLNPMVTIINAYRDILYYQRIPDISGLLLIFVLCTILLILGYKVFNKFEKKFAEEL
jgi:ABC-2 type transport system permease protein